jgi:hypothetical protein
MPALNGFIVLHFIQLRLYLVHTTNAINVRLEEIRTHNLNFTLSSTTSMPKRLSSKAFWGSGSVSQHRAYTELRPALMIPNELRTISF